MSTKHQELTFIGLTNRYNHKIKGLENCLQLLRFLCPLQLFPQHKKKNEVHNVWKLQKKSHSILWAKRATFYTLSGQKFIEKAKKWCILRSNSATIHFILKVGEKCQNPCDIFSNFFHISNFKVGENETLEGWFNPGCYETSISSLTLDQVQYVFLTKKPRHGVYTSSASPRFLTLLHEVSSSKQPTRTPPFMTRIFKVYISTLNMHEKVNNKMS